MITAELACEMCLRMPVVEQAPHHGHPDFRVKSKVFARLLPGKQFVGLKVGPEEQIMLSSQKRIFSVPEGAGQSAWINVRLVAISEEDFLALVWKAWHYTAPARLSLQY